MRNFLDLIPRECSRKGISECKETLVGFHLARIQWEKLTVPRKWLCALGQAPGTEDVTPIGVSRCLALGPQR